MTPAISHPRTGLPADWRRARAPGLQQNIIQTSLLGCLCLVWTNPSGLLATRHNPNFALGVHPKVSEVTSPRSLGFKSRGLLLQKSFHKHGPLLIIDFWVKQRGAACWVSRKNFLSMESFPQPAFGRVKVESASHQLQLSLECHSCSSGDFAQNVTQYRQFASPTHNPTR